MNILSFSYILLAQSDASSKKAATKDDEPGKVDADFDSVWESLDGMLDTVIERLPFLLLALVVFVIFCVIASITRRIFKGVTAGRESANLGQALGRVAQWVILFVGVVVSVAIVAPSITPAKVLATLGVGGVAIGFAFKDILQNFMAGLLILIREPFKIGDEIISGDYEGVVQSIETRATLIKTYDGRLVVIPNSQIYTNPVVVNTAFDSHRSQYDVGIGYGDNLREAIKIMMRIMDDAEGVLSDPAPDVLVEELAGSTVNLRARWWTAPNRSTVVKVKHDVISKVKEALDEAHIDMPFPTQVTLFHDQTEDTDGDRSKQREGWPAGKNPPKARPINSGAGTSQ